MEMTTSDWKDFLNARITQEQGNENKALETFDHLLSKYPDNQHLLSSRAFALARLGRHDEASAASLSAKYSELGRALSGDKDIAAAWTTELEALVKEADVKAGSLASGSVMMAW